MRNDIIGERLKVENITERCRKARLRSKKDSGDGTTRETKARKTETEMGGLGQPGHESHRNNKR